MIRIQMIHNRLFLGLTLCVLCISSFAGANQVIDEIVAKVDDGIITRSELDEVSQASIEQIRQTFPPEEWEQRTREIRTRILNQMINEFVCLRYARDNEIEVSEAEIEATIVNIRENAGMADEQAFKDQLASEGITLDELKETLRKQTLIRRVLRGEVYSKVRVTETEIKDYFELNSDNYKTSARVRVAVLMIDAESGGMLAAAVAEKKINEAWEKLKKGEDFSELVKQYSDGPAKDSGGDIGFLEEGKALPVVEEAAFKLAVGEFSSPLETGFGWVIVKVLDRVQSGFQPLQESRDGIEVIIREQKAKDLEQEWFDRQRARTFIEIMDL